jgi:hypothetical protein
MFARAVLRPFAVSVICNEWSWNFCGAPAIVSTYAAAAVIG